MKISNQYKSLLLGVMFFTSVTLQNSHGVERPHNPDKPHSLHYKEQSSDHHKHDHKDGSCCEACSQGLPCESEAKESNIRNKR